MGGESACRHEDSVQILREVEGRSKRKIAISTSGYVRELPPTETLFLPNRQRFEMKSRRSPLDTAYYGRLLTVMGECIG